MKIALITDQHFGARNDSTHFLDFFEKFYRDVFFPTLEKEGIDTVLILGDTFDRRKYMNFYSLKRTKEMFFDVLADRHINVHMLAGNHDTYFKNTNDVNSVDLLLREYSNISVIDNPKTISVGENAIAQYRCEETFPQTFGIYELSKFLSGLSLFDNPTLDFENQDYVTIKGKGRSARYYFSNPEITLKAAPDKDIKFPGADMEFDITQEDISALQKAWNIYEIPDLKFHSIGGSVVLSLVDKENETSNVFSLNLPGDNTG